MGRLTKIYLLVYLASPILCFMSTKDNSFPRIDKALGMGGAEEPKEKSKSSKDDAPEIIFNLKRNPGESRHYHKDDVDLSSVKEVECTQTVFMSPFHHPVSFSLNSSIYGRKDKTCKWNFIGTEPCIPILNCETEKLKKPCDMEYLQVLDGVGGELKVCGAILPKIKNLKAGGDLRDLYIRFRVLKDQVDLLNLQKNMGAEELFKCTVTCGKRTVEEGATQLEKKFEPKMNPKCYCGTKPNDNRILGGENAQKFEYPWLVALVETNTRQPFCGGSIVNNRFIQTAGHCIKGKFTDYRNIQIIVNGHVFDMSPSGAPAEPQKYPLDQLEKLDKANGSRRYNLEEIIVHPLYVSENNDFDIAMLKMQEDFDLNPKKMDASQMESILQQPRAICLPPPGSYLRTYAGKKAIIAGWGLPGFDAPGSMQILQKLEVNVYSPKECKEMFAHRINRRMICAGHREGGKDSCSGDSGGPLVLEDRPKVWYQIGSVSFGEGCGEEEHPGVYFRTTEGVQWITFVSNYHASRVDEVAAGQEVSATWCMTP